MIDFFKSELLRFRLWAVVAGMVNLLAMGFMSRLVDLAQQPMQIYQIIGIVYAVAGSLLGLFQMGIYRKPNQWLNLLHRPLHRLHIAAALCGAGTVVLLVAVALPIVVVAMYQDTVTARVVDLRHYMLPLAAWLIAVSGYLAGAYAMVANRRHSSAAFILPALFLFSQAYGVAMLAVQCVVVVFLCALLAIAFKPDPAAPSPNHGATLAVALPVQVSAYLLMWLLGFGVELGWTVSGTHPLNSPVLPKGGHVEADRAEGKDLLLMGIADSRAPDTALWREQVALSDVHTRYPLRDLARRNTMTNPAAMEIDDSENSIRWVFSHDRMRFVGYGLLDKRARGELGVGEAHVAFPAPTLQYAANYLFNAHAAYQYDAEQRRIFKRIQLPRGEVMTSPPEPAGDNILVLSNRAAYFYPGREAINGLDLLQPLVRVPMPGMVGNLSRVDVMELLDGYLVSYSYTWGVWAGELQRPFQQVLRVDGVGGVAEVARRELRHDLPMAYTTRTWWLSPVLRTLCVRAQGLFAAPDPLRAQAEQMAKGIVWLAVVCCLLSLLGAVWLTAHQQHARPARRGWILLCGVVGLPALVSLWLLYPQREPLSAPGLNLQPVIA